MATNSSTTIISAPGGTYTYTQAQTTTTDQTTSDSTVTASSLSSTSDSASQSIAATSSTKELSTTGTSTGTSESTIQPGTTNKVLTGLPAVSKTQSTGLNVTPSTNNNGNGMNVPAPGGATSNNVCTPPVVNNGDINSKGPYTVGTPVTFTCSAGFTLVGQATITCGTGLKWSTRFPSCLSDTSNTDENIGDNYYLGDSLPLWLAIILGMTFGVICLLMLVCLIMFCLRMCGCWKGAVLGESPTNTIAPKPAETNHVKPDVENVHKGTEISYVDLEPFPNYSETKTTGQPPNDSRYYFTNVGRKEGRGYRSRNVFAEPRYMDATASSRPEPRVKARKPVNKWMPHAREKRFINTSTN